MVIKWGLFKCHKIYLSPGCPQPRKLRKGKYKCSLCYRYFVKACVWVLQIRQIRESEVVFPHLSYREGG